MSRLWILPALGLSVIFSLACQNNSDDLPAAVATATPNASTAAFTATATSSVSASPSPTVPVAWATYTDPDGLFSARYPVTWFAEHGTFSTFQLGSIGPTFPPGAVKIDVGANPVSVLGACATPAPGSVPITVDGQAGSRISVSGTSPDVQQSVQVFVQRGATCYAVLAIFSNDSPGLELFDQFLSGLKFSSK